MGTQKKRVCYFYDEEIGEYYYGAHHPMKPHRLVMTHALIQSYGLWKDMACFTPRKATSEELCQFHSPDYIDFLRRVMPDTMHDSERELKRFNLGSLGQYDCPVFEGMYQFCQLYTGGSIDGAHKLNQGVADIAINWAGGLHHAKKSEASGFCYINDVVLAILELLKYHARVLYLDIDIHHGDGVEEAFLVTDRVMTVSFHKFGDFFPGTGDVTDIGVKSGKYYSVNVPLRDGMDDDTYLRIFKPIMREVMHVFDPGAIVLQCGADSLTGDRLGVFNLSLKGHGECVEFMQGFNKPMLVVGGGGYTIRNVARCWAYETSVILGRQIANQLPYNDYLEYFGPDFELHLNPPANIVNCNDYQYVQKTQQQVMENLRTLQGAPGVSMEQVPSDFYDSDADIDEDSDDR